MVYITSTEGDCSILRPEEMEAVSNQNNLAENLVLAASNDRDVTIHCNNNEKVFTNKVVLCRASKMLTSIFGLSSSCLGFVYVNFDLVCPDFSAEAVTQVLQILVSGAALVNFDHPVMNELKDIIDAFQFDIDNIAYTLCPAVGTSGSSETGQSQDVTLSNDLDVREVDLPNWRSSYSCLMCHKQFSAPEALKRHNLKHKYNADKVRRTMSAESENKQQQDDPLLRRN